MNKHFYLFVLTLTIVFSLVFYACGTHPPSQDNISADTEETAEKKEIEPTAPEKDKPKDPPPPKKKPELPSPPPMLSIETDMHDATINRMAIDADSRYLVTASDDKTVRVWDLNTAEHIKTLRPFSGPGNEGRIYSVAISPNGETIACGGWTKAGSDTHNIYLFNFQNGTLIHRIQGLPDVINHLDFSKNGQYLAAALGGNNGIRIFNSPSYMETARDTDYGSSSYWLDFDSRDRLVTSSYDGFIRLYNIGDSVAPDNGKVSVNLTPVHSTRTNGGQQPFGVEFSPDGSRIAVGFTDSTAIDVLSDNQLELMFSPFTGDKDNGGHGIVAWSPDAQHLFAGGRNPIDGFIPVYRWEDGGRGALEVWPGAKDVITQILGLPNGGVIYTSADPGIGSFSSPGKKLFFRTADIPNFRGSRSSLLLSGDGKTIQFGYEYGGAEPALFSVTSLRLALPAPGNSQSETDTIESSDETVTAESPTDTTATDTDESTEPLTPPDTQSLNVEGWKNSMTPKINGKALRLKPYEQSRSLAISPDKNSFIIGTQWQLRHYSRDGDELWSIPLTGEAWAVNISNDGRLAVAALGDGTIRWHSMADGRLLLSLFPHGDRGRWILWTPKGDYASSQKADTLIGWRVNRGPDAAADFFPVSEFSGKFHRPEFVSAALNASE